jgi:predicted membrane protein
MRSWDTLRSVMYGKDFVNDFVLHDTLGNLLSFALLLAQGRAIKRTLVALLLVLFGVMMMRWNVMIGGQAFSPSFSGFMHYAIPDIPYSLETLRERLFGILTIAALPLVLVWIVSKFVPSLRRDVGT